MVKHILLCAVFVLMLSGCMNVQQNSSSDTVGVADTARISVNHAEGFRVNYRDDGVCLVDIQDPQGENASAYRFALVKRGEGTVSVPKGYVQIEHPVTSAICMTSLQISNFIKLQKTDAIVGVTSTRHLFNKDVNGRIEEGKIARIGIEGNFDSELIVGLDPDIILVSPFKRGGYELLKDMDIPLVPHLGYKERTPLGQAEWIKFVGLLLGKTEKANDIFASIEKRYEELKAKAASVEFRPMVLSGETRGGNWYAPGGNSFLAQMIRDAGADYFLYDDNDTGGKNLDFETVYSRACNAQYWRIANSYKGRFSYDALADEDERYEDFRAFKEKCVLYCNMSEKPFYESMPTEPEVVLADLIHAFHPELLPNHIPVYYSLLK